MKEVQAKRHAAINWCQSTRNLCSGKCGLTLIFESADLHEQIHILIDELGPRRLAAIGLACFSLACLGLFELAQGARRQLRRPARFLDDH
jgi:hypothetical protein